jgi:hypothetical protein
MYFSAASLSRQLTSGETLGSALKKPEHADIGGKWPGFGRNDQIPAPPGEHDDPAGDRHDMSNNGRQASKLESFR